MNDSRLGLNSSIGALISVLLLSGVLAFRNTRQLREDAAWVAHTHEVLDAIQVTLTSVVDADTGQRGYLITNDGRFLEPYLGALARIRQNFQQLKTLVQDNPQQLRRIQDMEAITGAKVEEMKQTIVLQRRDPKQARQAIRSQLTGDLMDSLRGKVEAMTRVEKILFAERERQSRHSYQVAIWSGAVFALLGLAMVGALLVQLLAHLKAIKGRVLELQERATLEAQLQEAQKVQTLGVLAGGLAHDFNNLLAAIMGNASMGLLAAEEGGRTAHLFETIEKAAMKAANLTRLMLAYAGKGKFEVGEMDLGLVAREATLSFSPSLPGKVTLRCQMEETLPPVKGDIVQIQLIPMILLTNAAEAIGHDEEGLISIRTGSETVSRAENRSTCWPLPAPPGQYVTLEVTDSGTGMTSEILERAFEPFYTTKFTGRGLGLAAALGILRSHGGGLQVKSSQGNGSSFKVFLPAADAGPRTL